MLKKTALFEEHQRLNGRLVDFGGWELPVQYSGVIDEHLACRSAAGLFDVSHMGEVHVEGRDAERFLNYLVTNNVAKLKIGQAQYSAMCHASGGIVDDLVIYRRAEDRFLVVVNASNTEKDFNHILQVKANFQGGVGDLKISNESNRYTQIAIQGPKAAEILSKLTQTDLTSIKTYWFAEGKVLQGVPALLARTGYTGEDGFEVYIPWEQGPALWSEFLKVGLAYGLKPCGLGARDTLRLEKCFILASNEFEGSGSAAAQNAFTGTVQVTVLEVLANGNLVVAGEKQLAVSAEEEIIRISGVVNPATLVRNSVNSSQVADLRLEYRGRGFGDDTNSPGWLTGLLLKISPF